MCAQSVEAKQIAHIGCLEYNENLPILLFRCDNFFISRPTTKYVTYSFILDDSLNTKYSILDAVLPSCVLLYLCNVLGLAPPARDYSTEDGRPPQTTPGPAPRFLSWRDEALCSPAGWATPPNYGSHCCPSERETLKIEERVKVKESRDKEM